jgi:hypothetical protein
LSTGSSGDPKDDTYRGGAAFSEPETLAVRNFVQGLHNPKVLVSYHSYSELFLRPWAYTTGDPPGEWILKYISDDTISRMAAVHGHTYTDSIWYTCSGETTDYFWGEMRLAAFTPELRPASSGCSGSTGMTGCGGFAPPASEIIPCSQENVAAAVALIKDAGCRKLWIKDHPSDTGVEPSAVWTGSAWSHAFWNSPDIWSVPDPPVAGSTVKLFVRVHNDTGATMNNAVVRAYWTDPGLTLEFPTANSTLIGSKKLSLPPGDTTVSFPWSVPSGTNMWGERHWCVGAFVAHPDDRPLTTKTRLTSNMGIKNFRPVTVLQSQLLGVTVTNFLDVAAEYRVYVDRERLPPGWEVIVPPLPRKPQLNRKALLLGVRGNVLEPGETVVQPLRLQIPDEAEPGTTVDIQVHSALVPLVPGDREQLATGGGYTFRVRVGDCDERRE